MARALGALVRFVIGIICITVVMRFFGVTWGDIGSIAQDGFRTLFETAKVVKGYM